MSPALLIRCFNSRTSAAAFSEVLWHSVFGMLVLLVPGAVFWVESTTLLPSCQVVCMPHCVSMACRSFHLIHLWGEVPACGMTRVPTILLDMLEPTASCAFSSPSVCLCLLSHLSVIPVFVKTQLTVENHK